MNGQTANDCVGKIVANVGSTRRWSDTNFSNMINITTYHASAMPVAATTEIILDLKCAFS